jgi:hypothetical protein
LRSKLDERQRHRLAPQLLLVEAARAGIVQETAEMRKRG